MIKVIHLSNMKCFDDLKLHVAPLTLLTGFNAAGKSTSLQGLLLIAQALRNGGVTEKVGLNGPLVRLGSVGDVAPRTKHSSEAAMTVGIETDKAAASWTLVPTGESRDTMAIRRASVLSAGALEKRWKNSVRPPSSLSNTAKQLFRSVQEAVYLGASRTDGSDAYPSPDEATVINADVGSEGQFASWWYDRNAEDEINRHRRHPKESAPVFRRQMDAFLGDLFPGAQANVERLRGTSLVRLDLRLGFSSEWQRPNNIGYGLTYAFPILVSLLCANDGQVVVLDSPEAHLHPHGQSQMGRFISRCAAAGVQVFVETHSDHVLNGVRLAVMEGIISPGDVAVHFFSSNVDIPSQPRVISPEIDKSGNLAAWPDGFFDQSERDLSALAGWR
ncbi:MAG: DUF3696 domain-containing protein [Micropepsaceae bacterium]